MTKPKPSVVAGPVTAGAAAISVLLAACGSAGTTASGNGGTGGTGLARCTAAELSMAVDTSAAGGAAGSTYLPLTFTNRSSSACGMFGFPGVSFVTAPGGAGQQVGAAAQRNSSFGSKAVKLDPGGLAHAWIQVAEAANYPLAVCHPEPVRWLRVYPPGEAAAGYASGQFTGCSLPGAHVLTVLPVRSGKGQRGSVP